MMGFGFLFMLLLIALPIVGIIDEARDVDEASQIAQRYLDTYYPGIVGFVV